MVITELGIYDHEEDVFIFTSYARALAYLVQWCQNHENEMVNRIGCYADEMLNSLQQIIHDLRDTDAGPEAIDQFMQKIANRIINDIGEHAGVDVTITVKRTTLTEGPEWAEVL